jgi:hypothetical protein
MSFAAPNVDNLFNQPQAARSMLDGPVDEPVPNAGDPKTYPMDARRAAEQRARSARLGLSSADSEPAAPLPDPPVPKVIRVYDASEGTRLDPLKDKTWDLNSAKTIPDLGPPGGTPSALGRPAAKPARKVVAQAKPGAKPAAKPPVKPSAKVARKPKPKPAAAAAPADDDE